MRRLIAVLMLALLPFQFSWSAVAAYCMHERVAAQVQHVGHHEHQHEAQSTADTADKNGQSAGQFDLDCWVCHGTGTSALHVAPARQDNSRDAGVGAQPNARLTGVTSAPPDRPQWPVLA